MRPDDEMKIASVISLQLPRAPFSRFTTSRKIEKRLGREQAEVSEFEDRASLFKLRGRLEAEKQILDLQKKYYEKYLLNVLHKKDQLQLLKL